MARMSVDEYREDREPRIVAPCIDGVKTVSRASAVAAPILGSPHVIPSESEPANCGKHLSEGQLARVHSWSTSVRARL